MTAQYLRSDWRYLKLRRRPDGKLTPLRRDNGAGLRSDEIAEWASAGQPYGILTGPASNFVVVDIDPRNLPEGATAQSEYVRLGLPSTYCVTTPSGGLHAYLRAPAEVVAATGKSNQFGPGVDFIANWPYVVAPGVTRNGRKYEPCGGSPDALGDLPQRLCGLVLDRVAKRGERATQMREPKDPHSAGAASAHVRALATENIRHLQAIADLPEGGRYDLPGYGASVGWDTGVFAIAQRLVGLAAHPDADYTLEEAEEAFLLHAPSAAGTYSPHYKWECALAAPYPSGPPPVTRMFDEELEPTTANTPGESIGTAQVEFAHLLERANSGKLLHVHGLGWHIWDGKRWRADPGDKAALRATMSLVRAEWVKALGDKPRTAQVARLTSASAIEGILRLARVLPGLSADVGDLDADPNLLNTPAGTLDLRTLVTKPHDPADKITKIARGSYSPNADATRWDAFLARVLPNAEVRQYLARWAGMSLVGTVLEHVLLVLSGTGANGKSVFYEVLVHAFGDYGVTPPAGLLDQRRHEQHPSELMDLRGARLGILSETDRNVAMNERRMKSLTGGDPIAARKMYGDWVTFRPTWTLAMVTNHPPKVSADDEGVWRRLRRVEFGVTIPEKQRDPRLAEKLRNDADAVMTWAVTGLADFQRRSERLDEPVAVLTATASYRGDNDSLARFLGECCRTGSTETVRSSDLFARWCDWCREEGLPVGSARTFGVELERRGFSGRKGTAGIRLRSGLSLLPKVGSDDDGARMFTVLSGDASETGTAG